MARPSKRTIKDHDKAHALLLDPEIHNKRDAIEFVLANWDPAVASPGHQGKNDAFFTPESVAHSAMCQMSPEPDRRTVDICAGIGALTYAMISWMGWHNRESYKLTAIELNPDYVAVGKTLFPYVNWVCANAFDYATWEALGTFDDAISNPPFGHVSSRDTDSDWLGYSGPAALMVAALGLKVSHCGITLIMPQTQTPYRYSGANGYSSGRAESPYWPEDSLMGPIKKFMATFPDAEWGVWPEDMEQYRGDWSGVAPNIEIINLTDMTAEVAL